MFVFVLFSFGCCFFFFVVVVVVVFCFVLVISVKSNMFGKKTALTLAFKIFIKRVSMEMKKEL